MIKISLLASLALTLGGLAASSAQAATVTVGSPLTAAFSGPFANGPRTLANTALGEPVANLTSPISGVIVRWRMIAHTGGPFKLRVLRPAGGGAYTGAGSSATEIPTSLDTKQTFGASLLIQAGDLIGIDVPNNTSLLPTAAVSGSAFSQWNPFLVDGFTAAPSSPISNVELPLNADVQSPPGVSSISPPAGPRVGGTSVTITGQGFTGASTVSFGSTPAANFTVNSDSQITATSPGGPFRGGTVDIRVSAPSGETPAVGADRFTFGCVVPDLRGKKLKRAKNALAAADCQLGKVKPKGQRGRKVKKQTPKPGAVLAGGSKVNVKLG